MLFHFSEMSYNYYNIFSLIYAAFWCLPLACLWTCFWLGEWEVLHIWTENTRSSTNYMWQVLCLLDVMAICTCLHFHMKAFFMLTFQRPHLLEVHNWYLSIDMPLLFLPVFFDIMYLNGFHFQWTQDIHQGIMFGLSSRFCWWVQWVE